jgi:hypothetical protein
VTASLLSFVTLPVPEYTLGKRARPETVSLVWGNASPGEPFLKNADPLPNMLHSESTAMMMRIFSLQMQRPMFELGG